MFVKQTIHTTPKSILDGWFNKVNFHLICFHILILWPLLPSSLKDSSDDPNQRLLIVPIVSKPETAADLGGKKTTLISRIANTPAMQWHAMLARYRWNRAQVVWQTNSKMISHCVELRERVHWKLWKFVETNFQIIPGNWTSLYGYIFTRNVGCCKILSWN